LSFHSVQFTAVEPSWIDLTRRRPGKVPVKDYDCFRDESSLTRRVVEACSGHFSVRLLHQGWGTALTSERRLLGMRQAESAMVREVELLCSKTPWVFARTLIPATSLSGGARRLAYLGNKPLGAVLFADPRTQRKHIPVARILPRHPLFAAAVDHLDDKPEELWGRRTLFLFSGKPILVNEIFLPAIPEQ